MALPTSSSIVFMEWLTATVTPDALGTLSADVAAGATTMSLTAGFDTLPGGAQPVLIGSEQVVVRQSGATLTVEPLGRGYFGSTAAAHLSGATVSISNLSSIIGTNVREASSIEGWLNTTPGIVYRVAGGVPDPLSSGGTTLMRQPFIQVSCYGGQDSAGDWPELACDFVHRAFSERIEKTMGACGEDTTSGRLISVSEESEPQVIYDQDVKPEQPKVLTFATAQII